MFDNEIKAISLFFFFALLDDEKALLASAKCSDLFFQTLKVAPKSIPNVVLVKSTNQIWQKLSQQSLRGRPHFATDAGWTLPTGVDLAPWKEFQKSAPEEELLAILWSQILKISDSDIAAALSINEGTVRYRVRRGLKLLGGTMILETRHLEPVRS